LQHTSYIDEVVKANAHKQALNLEAEGRLDASRKDAESIKIRADAEKYKADLMNGYSSSVLEYMATIEEYNTMKSRTGDVVWVIPTGLQPSFIPTSTSGAT
jgi:regulator of protease activity HflC (stomatin/prohibitin superfamily)